jgi:UDP-glucose 4-epimerase
MKTVLLAGGAGYIGSHMLKSLLAAGYHTIVLDDLSGGHRHSIRGGTFIEGSIGSTSLLSQIFRTTRIDGVMHFASCIQVAESVRKPAEYYTNNVSNTVALLKAMAENGVHHFVFSSSAAVYGAPLHTPITESHPKNPLNPYGRSKWMVEQILADFGHAYGLRSMSLRYFNAAGADPEGGLGEQHEPETHLIPLILQAASDKRDSVQLFGCDYDTPDGTCIRDYVHVSDLCLAHLLALRQLWEGASSNAYNLGAGTGYSVRQVISAAEKITGRSINAINRPRRAGDPAVLVADITRARSELGWNPAFSDLETILTHAWQWEQR